MAEVASTFPEPPSAWTAKYGEPLWTVTAVSKPDFGSSPMFVSVYGDGPASTRHLETSVAPFQLAYSAVEPSLLADTASRGSVGGWAFQENR